MTVVTPIRIAGKEVSEPDARNIPVLKAQSKPEKQPIIEANFVFVEFFILNLQF